MDKWLFSCNICQDNVLYDSIESHKHTLKTGHNSFKMVRVKEPRGK